MSPGKLIRMDRATTIRVAAVIAALAVSGQAALADRVADGRLLASQCAQCHGTNGVSVSGIDSIAGEEYKDLLDKMLDMARPGETGNIMKHQAKGYTSYQLMLIAEYLSKLPKAD